MKKNLLLLLFAILFFPLAASSQLSVSNGAKSYSSYTSFRDVDYIFFFNGFDANATITYTGTGNSNHVYWYKASDLSTPLSQGQTNFDNFDDAQGYLLKVKKNDGFSDSLNIYFYVFDYSQYLPTFNSLIVEENAENPCKEIKLLLDATVPVLKYPILSGATQHEILREYNLKYNTLEWSDANLAWEVVEKTQPINSDAREIVISEPPLCNTIFTLTADDEFSTDLGITPGTVVSSEYIAVAVDNKTTTRITDIRTEENEDSRPDTEDKLSGSAPLEILFKAHPSDAANINKWDVYKNDILVITRNTDEHRYTFNEFGQYKVVLTSNNSFCSATDSVIIDVSESALWVPNAFSPNNDGANDEFRVAYRSLKNFECRVYNRWGRRVYLSTDPQKGWDGTIGGKPAAAAPYFYVITAEGTDGKKYSLKGDINLLR